MHPSNRQINEVGNWHECILQFTASATVFACYSVWSNRMIGFSWQAARQTKTADRLLDTTVCGGCIYDSAVTALVTSSQCDWLTTCWDSQSTVLVFHYSGMWQFWRGSLKGNAVSVRHTASRDVCRFAYPPAHRNINVGPLLDLCEIEFREQCI